MQQRLTKINPVHNDIRDILNIFFCEAAAALVAMLTVMAAPALAQSGGPLCFVDFEDFARFAVNCRLGIELSTQMGFFRLIPPQSALSMVLAQTTSTPYPDEKLP